MRYVDLGNPDNRRLILSLAADLLRDPSRIRGGDRLRAFAIGPKSIDGRPTAEFALIVMPDRKLSENALEAELGHGSAAPHEHAVFDGGPMLIEQLFGANAGALAGMLIQTDVVEIGDVRRGHSQGITTAMPHFHNTYVGLRGRHRPASIGVSVGHRRLQGAGTIGAYLYDPAGVMYALSCNHVLAQEAGMRDNVPVSADAVPARRGDMVIQPGLDVFFEPGHAFAQLYGWIDINYNPNVAAIRNYADAAIARVDGADISSSIPYLLPTGQPGPPGPLAGSIAEGAYVKKVGQASGLTFGRILHVGVPVRLQYGPGWAVFENQCIATHMSVPGDSGAMILRAGTNEVVGLLFGGSNDVTLFTPMLQILQLIERDLGIKLSL